MPAITQTDLADRSIVGTLTLPSEAAAVIDLDEHSLDRPIQQIFNATTRAYVEPGYAAALGLHDYIGNVGRIQTTAYVTHLGQEVGSQLSLRDKFNPFLADFGQVKKIFTEARVYTDYTCGLAVRGTSYHQAEWQFFTGTGVPKWGTSQRTTQAAPASGPECTSSGTGQRRGTETRSGGVVCHYLITYELDTGIIVNVERLQCVSSGGPQI